MIFFAVFALYFNLKQQTSCCSFTDDASTACERMFLTKTINYTISTCCFINYSIF